MSAGNYKKDFLAERSKLFDRKDLYNDAYGFCIKHSLLVEEYIIRLIQPLEINSVIAAVGGFSRRELSPYSDVDIMFICESSENNKSEIEKCIAALWDSGIEASHTVRELSDIDRFIDEDLRTFTQFFETRFLLGNLKLYTAWNQKLFNSVQESNREKIIYNYFDDVEARYQKYGRSPKVLEPNLKFTGGGLRDIHSVEWMYLIKNQKLLSVQDEITQTQVFIKELLERGLINRKAYKRLLKSYGTVLRTRNLLHLIEDRKNDRLEFDRQEQIAKLIGYTDDNWKDLMHEHFHASTVLHRFSKTMMKRYRQEFSSLLSDYLKIDLDDDFEIIGEIIKLKGDRILSMSDIMRAFYYRCLNDAIFEQNLRSLIIESIHLIEETNPLEATSSVFFREMLKLPSNVGKTLLAMSEFGFLDILLPEFKDLNGFFEPGVYHLYTADQHTLIALQNLENLTEQDNHLSIILKSLPSRDLLYLAVLLHDIGKPISISGHEIIGAEIANSVMQNLGYGQNEISLVQFLVKHHLVMEQIAFRRDINDPSTLDSFISDIPSVKALDHLYLLSYADLSAVNPQVWTQWKAELLQELYLNAKSMLLEQMSGEELIGLKSKQAISESSHFDSSITEHLDQIDDSNYLFHFSQEEIQQHIDEIQKGSKLSVFFKPISSLTLITVVTKDNNSLLSNLCGSLAINDINIHDARIFTRRDGIVIDSFSVTDFRTHEPIDESKYSSITKTITKAVAGKLNIPNEIKKSKSKWKRIVNKSGNNKEPVEIEFEEHSKFTIIDVYGSDNIGLLYTLTKKMAELGLTILFAKIATKAEGIMDSFYILKNNGKKLRSSEYDFIRTELAEEITKAK